jgi:hypothetical protein
MRARYLLWFLAVFAIDCASLDHVDDGTCGNGVIDNDEDCDTFAVGANQCGAPQTATACRLTCDSKTPCPDGWGCSVSGICRQPKGELQTAGDPLSAGVTTMEVGDFDGDRRKEILSLASTGASPRGRVHFFTDTASLDGVPSQVGILTSPAVQDFDGDGLDDIAFGYSFRVGGDLLGAGGVGMLKGQSDRSFVGALFPSFNKPKFTARIAHISGSTPLGSDADLAIARLEEKVTGALRNVMTSFDDDLAPGAGKLPFTQVLEGGPQDVIGAIGSGRLFHNDATSLCGEVAFALAVGASNRVDIYSPCKPTTTADGKPGVGWDSLRVPIHVTAPEKIVSGVRLLDVDGDGFPELLVGGATKLWMFTTTNGKLPLSAAMDTGLTDLPLATGKLDGDNLVDFVLPDGVLLSSGPPSGPPAPPPADAGADASTDAGDGTFVGFPILATRRWTSAIVVDLNGDRRLDVVASSDNLPDVDVLEGTGTYILPQFTLSTTSPVTTLAVADLDFDGVSDVVLGTKRASDAELQIAYGRLTFPPEPPKLVGRLPSIDEIVTGAVGLEIYARQGDLGSADGSMSLAALFASTDRQSLAPLLIDDANRVKLGRPETEHRDWFVRGLLSGHTQSPDTRDVVVIASARSSNDKSHPQGIWSAIGHKDGSFDPLQEHVPLDGIPLLDDLGRPIVSGAAGDFDGDKIEEIVTINDDPFVPGGANIHISHASTQLPTSINIASRSVLPSARARAVDIDRDGKLDFLVVIAGPNNVPVLDIFFGDGKSLSATPVDVPLQFGNEPVRGFAILTTRATDPRRGTVTKREIVVATATHVARAFVKADRTFDVTDVTPIFGELHDVTDVAVGDFDGDGVEDLAVADQLSIRIARQKAVLQ